MTKWPCFAVLSAGAMFIGGDLQAAQSASQEASGDLAAATCGEYLTAARAADPGQNPTAERREQAEDAQDALFDAMLWVHGYQTGRAGPDQAVQPLTRDWMIENIRRLARYCSDNSPDGSMRLVDAVRRM